MYNKSISKSRLSKVLIKFTDELFFFFKQKTAYEIHR